MLAVWAVASFLICALGYMLSLHWRYHVFIHEYSLSLIIGISAIYCDVLWLMRTSKLCRVELPRLTKLLPTDEARSRCMAGAIKLIYGRRRLALFAVASVVLGEGTFLWLGIRMPSIRMKIAALLGIGVAFALLGAVIAVASGFWRWLYDFGRERPRIIVFHPDRMGGMLPISEVTDWIIVMGSVLLALYSAGAHYSPYAHSELRLYSYSWVVLAVALLSAAIFIPAYSVHRCLKDAQRELEERVEEQQERLFNLLGSGLGGPQLDLERAVVTLYALSEIIQKLDLWPYRQLSIRIVAAVAIQLVLPITHILRP